MVYKEPERGKNTESKDLLLQEVCEGRRTEKQNCVGLSHAMQEFCLIDGVGRAQDPE